MQTKPRPAGGMLASGCGANELYKMSGVEMPVETTRWHLSRHCYKHGLNNVSFQKMGKIVGRQFWHYTVDQFFEENSVHPGPVINGLFNLLITGVYWGCNPFTNHLLTSCDIQVYLDVTFSPLKWSRFHHHNKVCFSGPS